MRPGQNKRMRGRNRRGPNPLTRSYESNGPDVKVRGTAQHIAEKYTQLARDAHASGDPVAAESYLQHAEHYYRLIAAAVAAQQAQINGTTDERDDEDDDFDTASDRFTFRPVQQVQHPNQPQNQPYGAAPPAQGEGGEGAAQEGEEGGERPAHSGQHRQRGSHPNDRRNGGYRQERQNFADRQNYNPIRAPRPQNDPAEAEQPVLPAFLTTPVRPVEAAEGVESAGMDSDDQQGGFGRSPFRSRRRRRGRGPREGGEDQGGFAVESAGPTSEEN